MFSDTLDQNANANAKTIEAKIPALPDVMTQFKLPKSMSKLKSRSKIFRSSHEDVTSDIKRSSTADISTPLGQHSLAIPPSEFVNHTPERISTVSSLVDQQGRGGAGGRRGRLPGASTKCKNPQQPDETFYRNAGGIDDYCPSPLHNNNISTVRDLPVSPGHRPDTDASAQLSFIERMQKGYRDITEYKFKSIFVKKTVVRQDDIMLKHYIEQYTADAKRQERYKEKIDRAIADNYEFEFKTSRRKSEESFGFSSPSDSPVNRKSNTNKKLLSEHSGDESGMELSPPARNPGIASTRFSRVRKVPLRMSLDEDDDTNQVPRDDEDEKEEIFIQNTLHGVRRQNTVDDIELEIEDEIGDSKPSAPKAKSFKKRFSGVTRSTSQGQLSQEHIASPKKRRAPLTPQQSVEVTDLDVTPPGGRRPSSPPENNQGKPFVAMKENFKRFQKSFKLSTASPAKSGAESEGNEGNDKVKQSKTQQFADRLKRFRSVDNVDRQVTEDEQEEREGKTQESPMHKFTSKLQEWKKSMKRKPQTQNTDDEEAQDTSPQKREKPGASLIKKLKHIRSRKNASTDDPDDDEEGGGTYREGFRSRAKLKLEKGVAAASQMPQMTMEKIKETKKYFRKTQEKEKDNGKDKEQQKSSSKNGSEESDMEESNSPKNQRSQIKVYPKVKDSGRAPVTRHYYSSDDEDEEDEYDRQQRGLCKVTASDPYQPKVLVPLARAAWTNKSIHSDSMDTGDDEDDILPRVLIHQDNSDVFESTIIIAVTRPISRSHSPSVNITELPPDSPKASSPDTKPDSWVPNRESISNFGETIKRELSKDTIISDNSKGHSRKHSMDSSSEDSWIKDVPRGISIAAGLNSLYEMDEPWKVQTGKKDEKLYKTKSIDIFDKIGGLKIFEDFDDELKYTPVVKIEEHPEAKIMEIHEKSNNENVEQDSGEELEDNPDDDNSSRVTRILKQTIAKEELKVVKASTPPLKTRDIKLKTHLYGNSTESLMGHLDANTNSDNEDSDEESDDEDEDDSDEVYNRPPSAAPSPPPSMSPPPPPLPERQPSLRLSKIQKLPQAPTLPTVPLPPPPDEWAPSPPGFLPPLPQTKPPMPPNRPVPSAPPKVPERTPSMSRVAKPLVKTSSLRLAYDEQVNPKDVGKVNKLISRFEPNSGGFQERPRIIPRIPYIYQNSGDYSEDDEDDSEDNEIDNNESEDEKKEVTHIEIKAREKSLDKTPTNKPKIEKSFSIDADNIPIGPINNNPALKQDELRINSRISTTTTDKVPAASIVTPIPTPPREQAPSPPNIPIISISSVSLQSDQNLNFSQPSSEYGSPMTYHSSRMNSTQVTPLSSPKDMAFVSSRRSRRSMTRDDERYFSFDSDEENSYYSISSTNSNRYIVDL